MAPPSLSSAAAQLVEELRTLTDGPIKARVRAAIQRLSVPALGTDDYGRFVVANEPVLRLTGFSEQELLCLGVPDITALSDESFTNSLWRAFLKQGRQTGKYDIRKKDGSTVTVEYFAIANIASGMHISLMLPVGV